MTKLFAAICFAYDFITNGNRLFFAAMPQGILIYVTIALRKRCLHLVRCF